MPDQVLCNSVESEAREHPSIRRANHFCTYFDTNYIVRGLTLFSSLKRYAGEFVLWVLCLDEKTHRLLSALNDPTLRPITLDELEANDSELLTAKNERSKVEYYFTLTPFLPIYILGRSPEIDSITYVDADLYFYSSPQPIFDELGEQSVLIIGHRFPDRLRHLEVHGIYNVGLLVFRNDSFGKVCLSSWREECLEWCGLAPANGRFADQKYLDDWPSRFPQVVVSKHPGAGLAPWNWMCYDIRVSQYNVTIDGWPLIFYHFHGFKLFNDWLGDALVPYGDMPSGMNRWFYGGYLRELVDTWRSLRRIDPNVPLGAVGLGRSKYGKYSPRTFLRRLIIGRLVIRLGKTRFQ